MSNKKKNPVQTTNTGKGRPVSVKGTSTRQLPVQIVPAPDNTPVVTKAVLNLLEKDPDRFTEEQKEKLHAYYHDTILKSKARVAETRFVKGFTTKEIQRLNETKAYILLDLTKTRPLIALANYAGMSIHRLKKGFFTLFDNDPSGILDMARFDRMTVLYMHRSKIKLSYNEMDTISTWHYSPELLNRLTWTLGLAEDYIIQEMEKICIQLPTNIGNGINNK